MSSLSKDLKKDKRTGQVGIWERELQVEEKKAHALKIYVHTKTCTGRFMQL